MFQKRIRENQASKDVLTVWDASGTVLVQAPLQSFPFEEEGMIRSSIEFYADPEPCEIHRGAIFARSVAHFKMVCPVGEKVSVPDLDPLLQALLPPQAAAVELR